VGKSTLLRAVTGTIDTPTDLAMLGQEPPFAADARLGLQWADLQA